MKRINAIYARQSVDRADSISIESQIEFCKYELKGGAFKEYKDKGYSGKNTVRPQLQQLLTDIRRGEVEKVIVYKLDRISRSILDFSNMMELFQQYQVEFVSSTEKFDTSTPMGRAMLNICIVFAQLERETIQKRVSDAYYSRSQKGFRMGGKPPYGYRLEEIMMEESIRRSWWRSHRRRQSCGKSLRCMRNLILLMGILPDTMRKKGCSFMGKS